MEKEVTKEMIRWERKDDGEKVCLNIGVEITTTDGDVGLTPAIRAEFNEAITRLTGDLANAKKRAKAESIIQISLEEAPGLPYKTIQLTYGNEVPDVPWTPGGPMAPDGDDS